MARPQPFLPLETHVGIAKRGLEMSDFVCDAGELVWCTYGTTSAIGKLFDRACPLTTHPVMYVEDEAYADGYASSHDLHTTFDLPGRRSDVKREKRFNPPWRKGRSNVGRKLPKRLPLDYHLDLAKGLAEQLDFLREGIRLYAASNAGARRYFGECVDLLDKVRVRLSALFLIEHPEEPNPYHQEGDKLPTERRSPNRSPYGDRLDRFSARLDEPQTPGNIEAARRIIQKLMVGEEYLNANGIDSWRGRSGSLAERKARFDADRREMLEETFLDAFLRCCTWLDSAEIIKTPWVSTYHLKHVVEDLTRRYVPNGAFVAATLYKGIPCERYGPNLSVALSKKWLRAEEEKRSRREPPTVVEPPAEVPTRDFDFADDILRDL